MTPTIPLRSDHPGKGRRPARSEIIGIAPRPAADTRCFPLIPLRYNKSMLTTDELRRVLGPVGICMPPPAGTGLDPAAYAREIEAAGFTSVWFPGMNSLAALASVEPTLAATERLVLGTGIASVWTWAPAELAAEANRLAAAYPDRFILGLGVSHAPPVEATGQAYVRPYSKMLQFLDELGEVDAPVVLAALGPRMLELSRDATACAQPVITST